MLQLADSVPPKQLYKHLAIRSRQIFVSCVHGYFIVDHCELENTHFLMQWVNDLNMLVAVFLKTWFSCGDNDMTLIKEVKREEKARVIFQSNDRELNLDDQLFHFK